MWIKIRLIILKNCQVQAFIRRRIICMHLNSSGALNSLLFNLIHHNVVTWPQNDTEEQIFRSLQLSIIQDAVIRICSQRNMHKGLGNYQNNAGVSESPLSSLSLLAFCLFVCFLLIF